MIKIHVSPNMAQPSVGRQVFNLPHFEGMTASHCIPDEFDPTRAILSRKGARIEHHETIQDGDEIAVLFAPLGISLVGVLINIVISAALSYAAQLILGPNVPKKERGESPTYGFAGIRNSYVNGATVPVVYGSHRVGGVGLSLFSRVEEGSLEDTVFILLALGEGQFNSIGGISVDSTNLTGGSIPDDILINGNPASGFRNVSISTRMGTSAQTNIPEFAEAATSFQVSSELPLVAAQLDEDLVGGEQSWKVKELVGFEVSDVVTLDWNSAQEETRTLTNVNTSTKRHFHTGSPLTYAHSKNSYVRRFESVTVAPGTECESWDINYLFPAGLYAVKGNGNQIEQYVGVQYRYRAAGDAWPAWGGAQSATHYHYGNFTGPKRYTTRIDFGSKDEWEVEFRRITPDDTNYSQSSREVWVDTVNLINDDAFTYPYTALIGMKALASNQLNNSTPTITALVEGMKVGLWAGDDPPTFPGTYTRNPAWIALDILRRTRFGGGALLNDQEDFDLARFQSWADYCDEGVRDGSGVEDTVKTATTVGLNKVYVNDNTGFAVGNLFVINPETDTADVREVQAVSSDGGGDYITSTVNFTYAHDVGEAVIKAQRRHRCDIVFDRKSNVWEAAQQVALCGRASIVKNGNKFYPAWDRPQEPYQLFSAANIIRDSFKFTRRASFDVANRIEVSFLNRDRDFEQDAAPELTPEAEALDSDTILETVQIYGITRPAHAHREARYHLNVARLRHTTIEFDVGLDSLAVEPGDVIQVEHPTIHDGIGARCGTGSSSTTVTLDHPVTIEADKDYLVRVHHAATDALETHEVLSAPGTYAAGDAIDIDGTWATTPAEGSVAVIGPTSIESGPYLVQRISTTQSLARRVVAVNYDPDVYNDYPGNLESFTDFGSDDNGPSGNIPSGNTVFPVQVGDLTAKARVVTVLGGAPRVKIALSWQATTTDGSGDKYPAPEGKGVRYLVLRKPTRDVTTEDDPNETVPANTRWQQVTETIQTDILLDDDFDNGVQYEFAVVGRSPDGGFANIDDAATVQITPGGNGGGGSGGNIPPPPSGQIEPNVNEFGTVTLDPGDGAQDYLPAPFFEARTGGWILGEAVARGFAPMLVTPGLMPDASDYLYVKQITPSALQSGSATRFLLDGTIEVGDDFTASLSSTEEGAGWTGTKTATQVAAVPIGAQTPLEVSGANLTASYETASKDAGAVPVSGLRLIFLEVVADQIDEVETWTTATMTWDSDEGKRQTWEGDPYAAACTLTGYLAHSTDGSTWSDWIEYRGAPVNAGKRYWKAKVEITRPSTDLNVAIREIKIRGVDK